MSEQESFECDGHIRKIKDLSEIQVGMVLRDINPDGSFAPFSDMVVYKITHVRIGGWQTNTHFHLARPYAHSHGEKGLVRVENFDSHTLELQLSGIEDGPICSTYTFTFTKDGLVQVYHYYNDD